MVRTIFHREFISSRLMQKKGYKFWLNLITIILAIIVLVGLLSYVYNLLYDKLAIYTNFNRSFLVVVIAVFFLLLAIYLVKDIFKAYFSNHNEIILLKSRPIDTYSIIFGKLAYIYIKALIYTFLTIFVFLTIYGAKLGYGFIYYYYAIIGVIILTFLEVGLSLLFSIVARFIKSLFVKKQALFILGTLVLAFALATLYAIVLKTFVNLVRTNSINSLFNTESVTFIKNLSQKLYPIYNLVQFVNNVDKAFNGVILVISSIAVFLLAAFIFRFYYLSYLNKDSSSENHYLDHKVRLTSQSKALVKKELFLSFNQGDGVFSYLSLIVIEPLLIYAVVSGINLIFKTGNLNYFRFLFPNTFLSLDAILIVLFIGVISASSSVALEKEKSMLIKLKVLPLSPVKQMSFKILVPYLISGLFYLVSLLVLLLTKEISALSFGYMFAIGLVVLLILNISTIYTDLKAKTGLFSLIIDFILPVIYVLVAFIVSILVDIDENIFYLIILGLELVTLLFLLIGYKKRITKGFLNHEVTLNA